MNYLINNNPRILFGVSFKCQLYRETSDLWIMAINERDVYCDIQIQVIN
jgi:hypothetical protein